VVGVAGVLTPIMDRGRPRGRGVDVGGKCIDDAFGVDVTVKVDGVLMAVGEGGNTNNV